MVYNNLFSLKLYIILHILGNELLKNLSPTSTSQECFGWAKCVKSTIQTEALSAKLLKGMHISDCKTKTKVDVIRNKFKLKKSIRKAKVVKSESESESDDEFKSCTKCGLKHPPSKCPACSEACYKCGKKNHFSSFSSWPRKVIHGLQRD